MFDDDPKINKKLIQVVVILFFYMVFLVQRWRYFLVFRKNIRSPFLIFLLMVSFNSVGMWTEIHQINSNGQTVFIDFNRIEEKSDSYVYWWMMISDTKASEKVYVQTDCELESINRLQIDLHSKPFGVGGVVQVQPEESWTYPSKDSTLYRFVEVVCEMAKVSPEQRQQSITNLLMSLEYKRKINELSEKEGITNSL